MQVVASHYGISGLLEVILDGLRAEGKDLDNLTPEDLAPVAEMIRKRAEGPIPKVGLHLLIGDTGPTKMQNVSRNLAEHRISVIEGVLIETSR